MFKSPSSFVISQDINVTAAVSVPFILPSDLNGKFEIIWTLANTHYIGTVGIKWKEAKIGSIQAKVANIYISTGSNYTILNPLPMANWTGSNFPESSCGSLISTNILTTWISVQAARVVIEFTDFSGVKVISDSIPMIDSTYIEIHSNQSPVSNNVRFYFPATKSDLWTTEASLKKISTHFETLLSSEYSEGVVLTEIKNDSSTYEKEFEDSEDEDEAGKSSETVEDDEKNTVIKSGSPFKQIKIDAIAHSTYRAFLHWIQTSRITFAPPASSYKLDGNPVASRRSAIDDSIKDSNLPRPVSPKSIYRLAHYYNIPTLKELALASIQSQLTIENIAFEVFGDLSSNFEEVRDIYVDFTARNWNEVSESKAMTEMERLAEIGEVEISLISLKISRKLRIVGSSSK